MIGLALLLALIAAQDTPLTWEKVGEVEGVTLEIAGVRAQGDLRHIDVRAVKGTSIVRYAINLDCKTRMSAPEGSISIYADGKFVEQRPLPPAAEGMRPVDKDPIAAPVAAYVCPK